MGAGLIAVAFVLAFILFRGLGDAGVAERDHRWAGRMSRHGRPITPGPPRQKGRFKDELRSLGWLAPYLWPRDSAELRVRVVLAMALLVAGKARQHRRPVSLQARGRRADAAARRRSRCRWC